MNHEQLHAEALPLVRKIREAGADSVIVLVSWTDKNVTGESITQRYECLDGNIHALEHQMECVLTERRNKRSIAAQQAQQGPYVEKLMMDTMEKIDKRDRGF